MAGNHSLPPKLLRPLPRLVGQLPPQARVRQKPFETLAEGRRGPDRKHEPRLPSHLGKRATIRGLELTRSCGHSMVGASTMSKSHRPYPAELHQRLVALVRKGRTSEELARQYEPFVQCIGNWVRQAGRDAGRRQDGLTTGEQKEVRRLRRENRTQHEEREILRTAAASFARETTAIPSKDSSS